jgi:hypothetical protein
MWRKSLRNTEVDEDSYNMDIGLATSFFDRKLSLGLVARIPDLPELRDAGGCQRREAHV